jgi:hypothetical protein
MFKAPGGPAVTPPASQGAASPQESEFTQFFKGSQLPSGREVNWKEVEKRPEPAPEPKPAGDFTQFFGRMSAASAGAGPVPAAPPAAERFAPSVVQVDEFAKIIAPRPASSRPQAAGVADDPEPAAKPKGPALAILLVVIAVILLLTGCAIYFFVIRK